MKTKTKKILTIFVGAQIIFCVLAFIVYKYFGTTLINIAYQGASIPFLTGAMEGRAEALLSSYIAKANYFFFKYFTYAALFILCEFIILLIVKAKNKYMRIVLVILLAASAYMLRYEYLAGNLSRHMHFYTEPYMEIKLEYPKLAPGELTQLGWAHLRSDFPKGSYIEFSEDKKPGTVRVGIFGGSFVAGVEAEKGYDFPSLLQEKFTNEGFDNVELINFGVWGYGVHQSYLLWEYIGKKYNLDYVVLMPFSFHAKRDTRFLAPGLYGPLHARYIAGDNNLKLIPVSGHTRAEAARIFNRPIQPWRYIRYNYEMPLFLGTVLPSKFRQRSNPFYHERARSRQEEAFDTYSLIFDEWAEGSPGLIVIADEDIYGLSKKSKGDIYFLKSQSHEEALKNENLYYAMWHKSAMGNQLLSDEIFSLLTGKASPEMYTVGLFYSLEYKKNKNLQTALPLYKYRDVTINIGEHPVASFFVYLRHPNEITFFDFKKDKTASLCLLDTGEVNKVKFAPLPFTLRDKAPVFLSFVQRDKKVKVPLGTIDAPAPFFGRISLKNHKDLIKPGASVKDLFIEIGDKSAKLKTVFMRSKKGQFININAIKGRKGTLDLVASDKEGNEERCPILSYEVTPVETAQFERVYQNPIK